MPDLVGFIMEGSPGACSVCLERNINTVFLPCEHETVCSFCASQLESLCCPVCRTAVSFVLLTDPKVSDEGFSLEGNGQSTEVIHAGELSKWCLSCLVRYRQEVELYLSKNIFSILFAGYTSRLKDVKNRFSVFVKEKEPIRELTIDDNVELVFKPSKIVSRLGANESLKPGSCPNCCYKRASLYDQQWGFSLSCEPKKAEILIKNYPCRFDYCQLWELVRRLQGGERLSQLLTLCFCSSSMSSFEQVVDMHNLIYRYKENYSSVGLPAVVWMMLDTKTHTGQSALSDVVSFDVIREKLQKIVPYDRPNAVVKVSFDSEKEESDFYSFYRITSELIEAYKRKTPRKWLIGSQSVDRGKALKCFI